MERMTYKIEGVSFRRVSNGWLVRLYDVVTDSYEETYVKNLAELGQKILQWAADAERNLRKNLENEDALSP